MRESFSRILILLRKEKGLSQKAAADKLGISQALLSHYEKGIRECGLSFVVRAADFYDVSADYLLGRTADKTGAVISVDDIPDDGVMGKENIMKGSILPTLNKKLIVNSLNIVFDYLQKCNHKDLTGEVSTFLMLSVYRAFRILYDANDKNPSGMFAAPERLARGLADAAMCIAEANAVCIAGGEKAFDLQKVKDAAPLSMSPEVLSRTYPLMATSLLNLIKTVEGKMELK